MSNHNPPTNGFDKRPQHINRKGKPKDFNGLRALAQQIAHEAPLGKDGEPLTFDGHKVSYAEFILRNWATSPDPRKQQAFIEYAYGKVPVKQEVSGPDGGPVQLQVVEQIVANRQPDDATASSTGAVSGQ